MEERFSCRREEADIQVGVEEDRRNIGAVPVSYTHLDVYKRQGQANRRRRIRSAGQSLV